MPFPCTMPLEQYKEKTIVYGRTRTIRPALPLCIILLYRLLFFYPREVNHFFSPLTHQPSHNVRKYYALGIYSHHSTE